MTYSTSKYYLAFCCEFSLIQVKQLFGKIEAGKPKFHQVRLADTKKRQNSLTLQPIQIDVYYPSNFEAKIGFDRIREMIAQKCICPLGVSRVNAIKMLFSKDEIEILLCQTEEMRQIILSGLPFPQSNYHDPTESLKRIKPLDTYLEPDELLYLALSYRTIVEIVWFLNKRHTGEELSFPWLQSLVSEIETDSEIPNSIFRVIDEQGLVRDTASMALSQIRKKKNKLEIEVNRKINNVLRQAKAQGLVSNDVELALRNGRQVIPVSAAYKRRIKGIVHDQSATGQTVYVEPEEIFEINNEIRELELEERREIIKVLKSVTNSIRAYLPMLEASFLMLGKIDFARAKALLAIEMKAQKPVLKQDPHIRWVKAYHPLLLLSYKTLGKHVEPLDIELDGQSRILVISGPNAGGKSVALKTCGLVQYMIQCGVLAPMESYSEAGVFEKIFIDIGDQQSIENDLSTYSSHLLNLNFFVNNSNDKTLFLADELGAGTEPRLGGAIAEAILEKLEQIGALGVVTTHYANLKLMAVKHAGISNGSMLFDTKNMKPMFRLKVGNPGSSFAFEIARAMGISEEVLKKAGENAGTQELDFDRQLQDLDLKKIELENKEKQLKAADDFLSEMIEKYETLNNELQTRKADILHQARIEARNVLSASNKIIEKTIRQIKESQANKEKTREARKELDDFVKEQKEETVSPPKPKNSESDYVAGKGQSPAKVGSFVRIKGHQSIGEVIDISGKEATVLLGNLKLKAKIATLEKMEKKPSSGNNVNVKVKTTFDINEKAANFNPEVNIIGLRVDEALALLRNYIDDAILLGFKQVKIMHGKGNGILRESVRAWLKTIAEVNRTRDEHPDRGGAGATIVDFR